MKHITQGKILIIADSHQRIGGYYKKILEAEKDWDYLIDLGDQFDTFAKPDGVDWYTVKDTCLFINDLFEKHGDKIIWLISNHNLTYFASHLPNSYRVRDPLYYNCSGWTKSKASEFNKHINPAWIRKNELCCQVGDFIISHAGFHFNHMMPFTPELSSIKSLHYKWEQEKQYFYQEPWHWIGAAGGCRGGLGEVGSPVWLDWSNEFTGLDHVKQIVGHSTYYSPFNEVKQKNGNYNIDAMQSLYAVWDNGNLEFKWTKPKETDGPE